ncbi:MAG TPA: hypothetical protein VFL36_23000 [Myxococcales bacterium]|nr:hypothetical protein [Myxococcales bacterium]
MTASPMEQARALVGLRAKLFFRRFVRERQWGRAGIGVIAAGMAAFFSLSLCALVFAAADDLRRAPQRLDESGGPLVVFAAWTSLALAGRLWFGVLSLAQPQGFLDPRRLRSLPVSGRLVSAINVLALFFDPVWLVIYPPLACIAVALARLPSAPGAAAMLVAQALAVWATVGALHLGSAVAAFFDARPMLRRGFSIAIVLGGVLAFQASLALPGQRGLVALFSRQNWDRIAWTPAGWMALTAGRLSASHPLRALGPALLLGLLGLACSAGAHALSQRELSRPQENGQGPRRVASASWRLPLLSARFSALVEKEAKTVIRVGWLQLVVVPVAYLLLVRAVLPGPEPLLIAAVYAHLGVLEIATNAFGRDASAARGWFLWPVSLRAVLAAKNAVAYAFSLAIFLLLALVAASGGRLLPGQFAVGLCAHAATFPLLATFGNVVSAFFPVPVRGARLRRVRGAGPIGSRLVAMALLAGAAWAPWALAKVAGIQLYAVYAGELVAMALAYPALLGVAAHLCAARRELLLPALSRDE